MLTLDYAGLWGRADAVVTGVVARKRCVRRAGGGVDTRIDVDVLRTLRGRARRALALRLRGGRLGRLASACPFEPPVAVGQELLLFVRDGRVLGGGDGRLTVLTSRDRAGRWTKRLPEAGTTLARFVARLRAGRPVRRLVDVEVPGAVPAPWPTRPPPRLRLDVEADASRRDAVWEAAMAWNEAGAAIRFVREATRPAGTVTMRWRAGTGPSGRIAETEQFLEDGRPVGARVDLYEDAGWGDERFADRYDVCSVALHELGHVLGLEHSADPRSAMHATIERGQTRRSSTPGDRAALRALYPLAMSLVGRTMVAP